jgi:hypothetical protein
MSIENASMQSSLRPSLLEVESELKTVKKCSWILSIGLTVFLIVVWPTILVNFGDYSEAMFKFWLIVGQAFILLAFIYSLLSPFIENIYIERFRKLLKNTKDKKLKFKSRIEPKLKKVVKIELTNEVATNETQE